MSVQLSNLVVYPKFCCCFMLSCCLPGSMLFSCHYHGCHMKTIPFRHRGMLYGKNSNISRLFLKLDAIENYDTFVQFIVTYHVSCAYQVSTTQLFAKNSCIKTKDLQDREKYIEIWNSISTFDGGNNASAMPFWQQLQDAMNNTLQEFLLANYDRAAQMMLAIDDDKVCFINRVGDMMGLKLNQFVRENRKGILIHTAAWTGTGMPLHFKCEQVNETSAGCAEWLLNSMFGRAGHTDLRNITVALDRGYWILSFLMFILRLGGDIIGTVMRSAWYPFTWDQPQSSEDERRRLSSKGWRSIFRASTKVGERTVTAATSRNGKGSLAAAMTTLFHDRQWDFNFANSKDYEWWTNESDNDRRNRAFQSIARVESELDFLKPILDLSIDPLTLSQNSVEWFLGRCFALTSSSSYATIITWTNWVNPDNVDMMRSFDRLNNYLPRRIVPSKSRPASNADFDTDSESLSPEAKAKSWYDKIVDGGERRVQQMKQHLAAPDDDRDEDSLDGGNLDNARLASSDSDGNSIGARARTRRKAAAPPRRAPSRRVAARRQASEDSSDNEDSDSDDSKSEDSNGSNDSDIEDCKESDNEESKSEESDSDGTNSSEVSGVDFDMRDPSFVRAFVKLTGQNVLSGNKALERNIKKIQDWLDLQPARRRYEYRKADELKAILKNRRDHEGKLPTKKAEIINKLVELDADPTAQARRAAVEGLDQEKVDLLVAVLRTTFMKKLHGEENEYCRVGHALEKPYAKQFFEDSRAGKTGKWSLQEMFKVGLVQHHDLAYAKNSIDFLSTATIREEDAVVEEEPHLPPSSFWDLPSSSPSRSMPTSPTLSTPPSSSLSSSSSPSSSHHLQLISTPTTIRRQDLTPNTWHFMCSVLNARLALLAMGIQPSRNVSLTREFSLYDQFITYSSKCLCPTRHSS